MAFELSLKFIVIDAIFFTLLIIGSRMIIDAGKSLDEFLQLAETNITNYT